MHRNSKFLRLLALQLALPPILFLTAVDPQPARLHSQERPVLEFKKWSGGINVPDPVALSVDNVGRVYVTQTRRRKIQDLDIREHRDWIPTDVGLRTVQQKKEFYHSVMRIGGDQELQKKLVQDVNGDGEHDWRDLTVISEAIYRLVDSDQDGQADEITTFAENFQTEVTGIAAGVLAFENSVYATIAPDLWKLTDNNADGVADERQALAHGFGLHVAYAGHDMHGLTVGPDGKIYWSIGDKGIHVTTPEGKVFAFPNQGGVLRCNPDGSDFEVFAHGLRNVQEFAFDQYGNIFGIDNDSDQPEERERFVNIIAEMDAGWRCNYQYRGEAYNPWMEERLWDLPGEQHPAYIVPPLSHYVDGPAGFKFNPGTALSPEYQDYFFMTSAPNGFQHAFQVEAVGDTFKMINEHQFGSGTAIVGLAFGPDGGLYGADWDGGYPLDEKGSVIRIDVPGAADSDIRREVKSLLAENFQNQSQETLVDRLGHADQRVRMKAQFELVARQDAYALSGQASDTGASTVSRLHALWGLGQLARAGDTFCRDTLVLLFADKDAHVRAQAAKTYGELNKVSGEPFIKLLSDDDLTVRVMAGLGLARQPVVTAVPILLTQSEQLTAEQHNLRHSIVTALARCADATALVPEKENPVEMRRLCCVLALRRQASEQVASFLQDPSDWVANEAARAIHDDESIVAALPPLASSLNDRKNASMAFLVRAINANYRIGDALSADRVAKYATQEENSLAGRLLAADALTQWMTPPLLDRVDGRRRDLPPENRDFNPIFLKRSIASLSQSSEPQLRTLALDAARRLKIALPLQALQQLIRDDAIASETRVAALSTLSEQVNDLLLEAAETEIPELQIRALQLLVENTPATALNTIRSMLKGNAELEVKQAAIALLAEMQPPLVDDFLHELGTQLLEQTLPSGLQLDVVQSLERHASNPNLQQLHSSILATAEPTFADKGLAKFGFAREGGNQQRGERLFQTHLEAQCSRCHRTGRTGSNIGPALSDVGLRRDADYLLRSILTPSSEIDEKYRTQMLLLESGEVVQGVVQSADATTTTIVDSRGQSLDIPTVEIEEQAEQKISLMPPMAEILTPLEVRDVMAYLQTLKKRTQTSD